MDRDDPPHLGWSGRLGPCRPRKLPPALGDRRGWKGRKRTPHPAHSSFVYIIRWCDGDLGCPQCLNCTKCLICSEGLGHTLGPDDEPSCEGVRYGRIDPSRGYLTEGVQSNPEATVPYSGRVVDVQVLPPKLIKGFRYRRSHSCIDYYRRAIHLVRPSEDGDRVDLSARVGDECDLITHTPE
jgi:hypothetical protein